LTGSATLRRIGALSLLGALAFTPETMRSEDTMTEPVFKNRPGGREVADRELPGITVPAQPGVPLEIAPGVYQSDGMSNSWLLVTREGRIVINTGMGFEGRVHRAKYDAVDDGPIRYVIFTQGHVDHVGGTDVFLEDGTEIIAQVGNQAHQALDQRIQGYRMRHSAFAFPQVRAMLAGLGEDESLPPAVQSTPEPTITFEDEYAFSLGGLDLELMWIPGGETNDSIIVWLPKPRIAIVGNLFGALFGHVPNLVTIRGDKYRESEVFSAAIERVRALEPEILALGHHEPLVGAEHIAEQLDRLHAAVEYVHDETVRYMNAGKDVYTAMAEIHLPPELEVGQGYGKVAWNVRGIWENYVGWFNHLSTTELYAPPPASVYPDLVELAGAENVVRRARERIEAGEPVQAIHLTEAVLAAEPGNRGALTVYRDAHVMLEADSQNFWEISWLRDQIRISEEKLAAAE
jgi:alkyl sulfatase BDS1-like metallo-beta-lactamase superfamily hydrolase